MYATRVILDSEALLMVSVGGIAVGMPEVLGRTVLQGASEDALTAVPVAGAAIVGLAFVQRGIVSLNDVASLRVVLQGRMLTDLLMSLVALRFVADYSGDTEAAVLGATSVALIYAAARFYALVSLRDAVGGNPSDTVGFRETDGGREP